MLNVGWQAERYPKAAAVYTHWACGRRSWGPVRGGNAPLSPPPRPSPLPPLVCVLHFVLGVVETSSSAFTELYKPVAVSYLARVLSTLALLASWLTASRLTLI